MLFDLFDRQGHSYRFTVREGATAADVENMIAITSTIPFLANKYSLTLDYADKPKAEEPGEKLNERKVPDPRKATGDDSSDTRRGGRPARGSDSGERGERSGRGGDAGGTGPAKGKYHIVKAKVTGDADKPTVEMWSDNTKLQWPVLKAPSKKCENMLVERYGDDIPESVIGKLYAINGRNLIVDWTVHWERSPKNEAWKDVVSIIDNTREEE